MIRDLLDENNHSEQHFSELIKPYQTVITVLGAGGAGNNTIARLTALKLNTIQTIAVNTDAQDLLHANADRRILIGKNITGGLGAGGDPVIGERSAEENKDVLLSAIEQTDMLFLTCGLGGGTGTGSIPYIGELAKSLGILTIAIVTMPFTDEGIIRWENAQLGLEKLRRTIDTVIVLRNDKLLELVADLPLSKAFSKGDEILHNAILGLTSMVTKSGLINLDFADINTVMKDGPDAVIGLGESNSDNRIEESVKRAISHPMMEGEIRDATSVLVHVSSGPDMTLNDARRVIANLSKFLHPHARILWGITIEKRLKHTVRVMIILSGLREKELGTPEQEQFDITHNGLEVELSEHRPFPVNEPIIDNGRSIFDIKEAIMENGEEVTTKTKSAKAVTQTTMLFYKILEEEAVGDFKRFDKAVQLLRENHEDRKALSEAKQACKLLQASAQMFGFDEISQLLTAVEEIMTCIQTKEIKMSAKILDSITLAMELVVDLIDNRSDGRGETGYIVDRLRELKQSQLNTGSSKNSFLNY